VRACRLLEAQLAKYAVPDDIVFIDEIPHNATGKVRCVFAFATSLVLGITLPTPCGATVVMSANVMCAPYKQHRLFS
jgi:hypothetical protein